MEQLSKIDKEYIRKIVSAMNDLDIHGVVLSVENNKYLRVNISKPFDRNKDHFIVSLEDLSYAYYNGRAEFIMYGEFDSLEECFESDIYKRISGYTLSRKFIGGDHEDNQRV